MNITTLADIYSYLENHENKHLVIANGVDEHSIKAAYLAIRKNIVRVTLIGDRDKIAESCMKVGVDVSSFNIVSINDELEATACAVKMGRNGEADLLMKGLISTDQFMKAVLNKESGILPPNTLLSHVTLLEHPNYHKLLVFGDVAVIPAPTKEQKVMIARYLIGAANNLGIEKPRLALIAATEKVIQSMPACTDAVYVKEQLNDDSSLNLFVEGPMGLDIAIDRKAAEIKGFESPVAGNADCLLFPNIESGNVFYKTNTKLGNGKTAAVLVGTKVPTVLSSRGDSMETKLNSIAFAALKG